MVYFSQEKSYQAGFARYRRLRIWRKSNLHKRVPAKRILLLTAMLFSIAQCSQKKNGKYSYVMKRSNKADEVQQLRESVMKHNTKFDAYLEDFASPMVEGGWRWSETDVMEEQVFLEQSIKKIFKHKYYSDRYRIAELDAKELTMKIAQKHTRRNTVTLLVEETKLLFKVFVTRDGGKRLVLVTDNPQARKDLRWMICCYKPNKRRYIEEEDGDVRLIFVNAASGHQGQGYFTHVKESDMHNVEQDMRRAVPDTTELYYNGTLGGTGSENGATSISVSSSNASPAPSSRSHSPPQESISMQNKVSYNSVHEPLMDWLSDMTARPLHVANAVAELVGHDNVVDTIDAMDEVLVNQPQFMKAAVDKVAEDLEMEDLDENSPIHSMIMEDPKVVEQGNEIDLPGLIQLHEMHAQARQAQQPPFWFCISCHQAQEAIGRKNWLRQHQWIINTSTREATRLSPSEARPKFATLLEESKIYATRHRTGERCGCGNHQSMFDHYVPTLESSDEDADNIHVTFRRGDNRVWSAKGRFKVRCPGCRARVKSFRFTRHLLKFPRCGKQMSGKCWSTGPWDASYRDIMPERHDVTTGSGADIAKYKHRTDGCWYYGPTPHKDA